MFKIEIPEKAKQIINQLEQAGYEAYVVGGPVRDCILGKCPTDWDITTSASPYQVKEIFSYTIDTGIAHGTVTVMMGKEPFEVTTYRVDGEYRDHRRPEEVCFTKSLKEDLLRRDFTINAMAYNDRDGLIDYYGGAEDLKKKTIRCVGDARRRFDEDALRILRALRFQAQLGFVIEEETKQAIQKQAKFLKDISAERIQTELTKLLLSDHPETILDAFDLGVTKVVLPEFDRMMETPQNNPHHCYNVGVHTVEALKNTEPDHILRWTMLLHDVGKPEARVEGKIKDSFQGHNTIGEEVSRKILKRLKFDNQTIKQVTRLVYWHDVRFVSAQSTFMQEEKQQILDRTRLLFEEIKEEKDCLQVKDLALDGKDLISLGMKPGREIGEMLAGLLELVLEDPAKNKREVLEQAVRKKRGEL